MHLTDRLFYIVQNIKTFPNQTNFKINKLTKYGPKDVVS